MHFRCDWILEFKFIWTQFHSYLLSHLLASLWMDPLLMMAPSNFRLVSSWVHAQCSKDLFSLIMTGQNGVMCLYSSQSLKPRGGNMLIVKIGLHVYFWSDSVLVSGYPEIREGCFPHKKLKVWLPEKGKGDSEQTRIPEVHYMGSLPDILCAWLTSFYFLKL